MVHSQNLDQSVYLGYITALYLYIIYQIPITSFV